MWFTGSPGKEIPSEKVWEASRLTLIGLQIKASGLTKGDHDETQLFFSYKSIFQGAAK